MAKSWVGRKSVGRKLDDRHTRFEGELGNLNVLDTDGAEVDARDISPLWRSAVVLKWSEPYGGWLDNEWPITIRPNESAFGLCLLLQRQYKTRVKLVFGRA